VVIVVFAMTVILETFSSMPAIRSRIGPASPTCSMAKANTSKYSGILN